MVDYPPIEDEPLVREYIESFKLSGMYEGMSQEAKELGYRLHVAPFPGALGECPDEHYFCFRCKDGVIFKISRGQKVKDSDIEAFLNKVCSDWPFVPSKVSAWINYYFPVKREATKEDILFILNCKKKVTWKKNGVSKIPIVNLYINSKWVPHLDWLKCQGVL